MDAKDAAYKVADIHQDVLNFVIFLILENEENS